MNSVYTVAMTPDDVRMTACNYWSESHVECSAANLSAKTGQDFNSGARRGESWNTKIKAVLSALCKPCQHASKAKIAFRYLTVFIRVVFV